MLDAGIYEQLSRLVIAMKQKSSQNMAGNRRSVQKGTSAEFSDFREYMPGDDLRRLDWNVYARSERMYIREYFEEKGISVIRLGLHDSESLRSSMAAGAFHPAMRELCESRIMLRKTLDILDKKNIHGGTVQFGIAPCSVSRFTGQKRCNINALREASQWMNRKMQSE